MMNEFDDVPFISADELICYLGLGMLAAGIAAGLFFAIVPLARYVMGKMHAKWMIQKQSESSTNDSSSMGTLTLPQPESA
jgi:hypothetical protein